MLGVRSSNSFCVYDWETTQLIRRIEIVPKHAFWSENGEQLAVCTDDSVYILRYNAEIVANTPPGSDKISEDGVDDAFEVVGEVQDVVKTGVWIGDCFVYTTAHNRLNYYVGGEIVTVAHLDRYVKCCCLCGYLLLRVSTL